MGRASNRKKQREHTKWELMEEVVALLEKSLVPDAKVRRNVHLPILRTGREAQIDVLIQQTNVHGETVSIVEVQKRSRAVQYNDYRGWLTKLEDIGAQHLICVSEKPFPQSIVEDAKTRGNMVRLLTLSELKGEAWPIRLNDKCLWFATVAIRVNRVFIESDRTPAHCQMGSNTKCFRRAVSGGMITANQLGIEASKARGDLHTRRAGSYNTVFSYRSTASDPIEFLCGSKSYPVSSVRFDAAFTVQHDSVPLTCAEYVQINYKGALAYAMTGAGIVDGKQVQATMIFRPMSDGLLQFAGQEITGIPSESLGETTFTVGPPADAKGPFPERPSAPNPDPWPNTDECEKRPLA